MLGEGGEAIRAQLGICPLLVKLLLLAIDHALHLFSFVVSFDKLARSHRLGIAIPGRSILEHVKDGSDVFVRAGLELVGGASVAAGNGLAVDARAIFCLDGIGWWADGLGLDGRLFIVLHGCWSAGARDERERNKNMRVSDPKR